jgi:putative oxidoreductase
MQRAGDIAYLLLRVVSGLLFFWAGGLILFGWFGGMPGAESPPPVMTQTFLGGVIELVGGAAILLGLFTRPAAFVSSGTMAVAYWQFHAPQSLSPLQNQGIPAIMLCFVFLYVSARGGGPWSLDRWIRRR